MSEEKKSNEGKPMFIESLMTDEEWTRRMKAYPNTSRFRPNEVNLHKTNSFKWRLNMGKTLSSMQIGNMNRNLDYLLKKAREAHG